MTNEIDKLRLKIKNTATLKRTQVPYSLAEARALEKEIKALEDRIDKLEFEALHQKTLTIDIVGREF